MIEIPMQGNDGAWRSLSVNISGVSLSIGLLWNSRDSHWFAELESVDGKNNGVKLVVNTPLLSYKNKCLKGGDLVVLKKELDCRDPLGFKNLGEGYALYYVEDSELDYLYEVLTTR